MIEFINQYSNKCRVKIWSGSGHWVKRISLLTLVLLGKKNSSAGRCPYKAMLNTIERDNRIGAGVFWKFAK